MTGSGFLSVRTNENFSNCDPRTNWPQTGLWVWVTKANIIPSGSTQQKVYCGIRHTKYLSCLLDKWIAVNCTLHSVGNSTEQSWWLLWHLSYHQKHLQLISQCPNCATATLDDVFLVTFSITQSELPSTICVQHLPRKLKARLWNNDKTVDGLLL